MSEHSTDQMPESLAMSLHSVPHRMREVIIRYLLRGQPMGSFLTAVFSNNFVAAVSAADSVSIHILPAYAKFLYDYAPAGSWRSRGRVLEWEAHGGMSLESMRLPPEWARDIAAVVAAIKAEGEQ